MHKTPTASRTLAQAGHTVYASMRDLADRNATAVRELRDFAFYPTLFSVKANEPPKDRALLLTAILADAINLGPEFSCYTHSELVGVVRGVGNSRGEVTRDPSDPSLAAEQLGREIFERKYSDFRLDTQRSGRVWPAESANP